MSKHLGKDTAVWNRLMYGISRQPPQVSKEDITEQAYVDEKRGSPQDFSKTPSKSWFFWKILIYIVLIRFAFTLLTALCNNELYGGPVSVKTYGGYVDESHVGQNVGHNSSTKPQEIIEVSYPFVRKSTYGKPVHSQVLIDEVFDSWGHPSLKKFTPPRGLEFNKVVLTLNTSVSGVQFDRLAHLYIGGAEIWRTSTAEPGHKSVFTSSEKDVSHYAHLFQKDTDVLFQLDNLITDKLTGAIHVELYADFYSSKYVDSDAEHGNSTYLDEKYKLYDTRKAADKVYPLVEDEEPTSPPIKHLPYQGFSVELPKVSHNTTRLKLAIFASGNSKEEFWYSNVLDKYTHRFEKDGTIFHGHGPLRFVNVWVDGQKVATQAPQPFIFTGGYSPALWNAVAPINAFDLPSIDLDISGLLPLFWDSLPHELRITVDNGLDEVDGTHSGIGNDWIISANLLTYENAEISMSSGHVVSIDDKKNAASFGISLPYTSTLQQIVDGKFEAEITSHLVHELKSGDILNTTLTSYTLGAISSIQLYSRSGKSAKIVHVSETLRTFTLVDNNDGEVIHQTEIFHKYPLNLLESSTLAGEGSDLEVILANGKITTLKINDREVMYESNFQNGTSTYHLREAGNYGTGALDTKFKSVVSGPNRKFVYKRSVEASEGVITKDRVSFKEHDKSDENHHKGGKHHDKDGHHNKGGKHHDEQRKHKCGNKK